MRGATWVSAVLVGLLGVSACGVAPPEAGPPRAAPAAAVDVPFVIHPAAARPGQELAVQFHDEGIRGIAFSLDGWDGRAWEPLYVLTSQDQSAHREPAWWRAGEPDRAWVDVAVTGPGPDHIVVPPTAPAGDYRLCTLDTDPPLCGLLTIGD